MSFLKRPWTDGEKWFMGIVAVVVGAVLLGLLKPILDSGTWFGPRKPDPASIRRCESADVVVRELYLHVLERAPDSAGLNTFSGQLKGGAKTNEIVGAMVQSDEFKNRFFTGRAVPEQMRLLVRKVTGVEDDPAAALLAAKLTATNYHELVRELVNSEPYLKLNGSSRVPGTQIHWC